jgi:beta-lactamase class D
MASASAFCILSAVSLGLVFGSSGLSADESPRPLRAHTGETDACIALYDSNADEYRIHNLRQCQERLSPCSTFKIPNALIGLETGVLSGPDDRKRWDGREYPRAVMNRDHDLASAIQYSIVWYFQEVARDIGPERMQAALDAYAYGNRDISSGQDRFWLSGSLKISALEQIRFMRALDRLALPARGENQSTVRSLMLQDGATIGDLRGRLYGKTGGCMSDKGDHGWFTGFYHVNDNRYVFAVNVKGKRQWGQQAREIAIRVLGDLD